MKKTRLQYLDFVRAIATITIIMFHYYINEQSLFNLPYKSNVNLGEIGVSLFFIVSGAALMYSYYDRLKLKDYIIKRFLSIYPMYWIAYLTAFLYLFYVNKGSNNSLPKTRYIYTLFGFDGYLSYKIPTFYILGEWFLGCIILFYIWFPILRLLINKFPKILIVTVTILYFVVLKNISKFDIPIGWNIAIRFPEFIFGMYFVKYIKKINTATVIMSIFTYLTIQLVPFNINHMYEVTLTGILLFFILGYIGQHLPTLINNMSSIISKYSYAIFLSHHVIISQMQIRFSNVVLTKYELLYLFIITCIIIFICSRYLYIVNNKIIPYFRTHYTTK